MGLSWSRRALYSALALAVLALVGAGIVLLTSTSGCGPACGGGAALASGDPRPTGSGSALPPVTASPAPSAPGRGSPSAVPPPATATHPPSGGKPGTLSTGVPPGVKLTVVNGDRTYAKDGEVISGQDIRGFVRIRAKNVTIKNSIIRGGGPGCNGAVISIDDGASATIMDSEITPTHPHPCLDGISATNATLVRLDIHGVVDGVKAFDNVTIRDSYIHDLSWFASDPNQGGGETHNDAVQTFYGSANIVLRHNTLDVGRQGNAAYQVTQDFGGRSTNIRVEDNWLDGGGCTLNFAHKGGPTPMTGIYVIGNRFGRNSVYDCPILVSTKTVLSQLTGNVWDDTGKPIPRPQRHD